jgi:predicted MPP superfamily phosphohydrolase
MLVYGALYESHRIVLERRTLRLKGWPPERSGYTIAVLSDLHLRNTYSVDVAQRAVAKALSECPDIVVFPGDFIDQWKPGVKQMLLDVLEPMLLMEGKAVAVPGNHDYELGKIEALPPILDRCGIRLLRNEVAVIDGVQWVGVDSASAGRARTDVLSMDRDGPPAIALWHEPDLVAMLPPGCVLQISGHSHGGQFRFPGGFTPMHTELGRWYPRGWYPKARTPLYVSRGIGTTGPPSRYNCPPEVSLLTLVSADGA